MFLALAVMNFAVAFLGKFDFMSVLNLAMCGFMIHCYIEEQKECRK